MLPHTHRWHERGDGSQARGIGGGARQGVGAVELANQSYEAWVYLKQWWGVALDTPIFGEELRCIHEQNVMSRMQEQKSFKWVRNIWRKCKYIFYHVL